MLGLSALLVLSAVPSAGQGQPEPGGAFPPPFPPYPRSTSFAAIKLWIVGNTNLDSRQVVLTSAEAVFAFEPGGGPDPASGGDMRREVREEVLNPSLASRLGGRSASASVTFDCSHAETTVNSVMVYPGASLGGGAGRIIPASQWLAANTSLDLVDLAQAACGDSMVNPEDAAPAKPADLRGPVTAPAHTPARRATQGPWMQIGAFGSTALADQRWRSIRARWPSETEDLIERTETVAHGKGALQRALIGPFPNRQAAEALCERLKAAGGDCLVR